MGIFNKIFDSIINGKSQNTQPVFTAASSSTPQKSKKSNKYKKKRREVQSGNPFKKIDYSNTINKARSQAEKPIEESVRIRLLDSFLRSSHGDLKSFKLLHIEALESDPLFYGHLARWYFENGAVRDHQELFTAHLLSSPFPDHREHGIYLFQLLRPYQAARIVKYSKEIIHYPTRALKTAVTYFIKRREENILWFDECIIRDRESMKYLYSTLHIKPDARAQKILFEDDPPKDCRVGIFKEMTKLSQHPDKQAQLILHNRLHFATALGAVKHYTPSIIYAFAAVMTPPQVINNLKFFEKKGALNDPDTRKVIEEKLKQAVTESRVSDFKAKMALSKIQADENLAKDLLEVTGKRLQNRGKIKVPTAIFVDKSGSMSKCIELGKLLATICSTIATSDLHVYAFDGYAFKIEAKTNDFQSWDKAFSKIKADGWTSIGAPLKKLMNEDIDQVLIISDGEDNTQPMFGKTHKEYEEKHNKRLRVIFLKVHSNNMTPLEKDLQGADLTVIPFDGDYYNLPNVVPILCAGSTSELVCETLSKPLYSKSDLPNLPKGFDEDTYEVL